MSASVSAAQVNFDALGIPHKPQLLQIVADDAESYVREIIAKASILYRNSHAEKLTPQHINTILDSCDQQQLLGYSNSPSFLLSSIGVDNSEIFIVKEPTENLETTMRNPTPPKPRDFSYGFQWFLTEGVPAEIVPQRREVGRPHSRTDAIRPSSVDTTSRSYSTRQFVGDVLHIKHQAVYVNKINMLRDDISNQRLEALKYLRTDQDLQPLLPYFLQFVIGGIAMHYNDPVLMDIVVSVALALAENPYLCISIFTHAFVRIATTILITPTSSSNLAETDCAIRSKAAKLLGALTKRCEDPYPGIRVSVFNFLVDTLFNKDSTMAAQYGALCGIEVLGFGPVYRLIPHLPLFCKLISKNKDTRQQTAYVLLIKEVIYRLIHVIQSNPEAMDKPIMDAISKIQKIDF